MKKQKVLVIDDDPNTCSLLETVLQLENFHSASVNNIINGDIITLLDLETPDFVILDYHLSGEEALNYIKLIRRAPNWQGLPLIVTSAIDRRQECLAAGANEFILKPFNWQEIMKSINQLQEKSILKEV